MRLTRDWIKPNYNRYHQEPKYEDVIHLCLLCENFCGVSISKSNYSQRVSPYFVSDCCEARVRVWFINDN